jgi:hypothetical protein
MTYDDGFEKIYTAPAQSRPLFGTAQVLLTEIERKFPLNCCDTKTTPQSSLRCRENLSTRRCILNVGATVILTKMRSAPAGKIPNDRQ